MGSLTTTSEERLALVPWNPHDETHVERMHAQRLACGWGEEEVEEWKQKAQQGDKVLFWLKLTDELANADELLQQHFEKHESERQPIIDTARLSAKTSRIPTDAPFVPIGHVALELFEDLSSQFGMPKSTFWVKSLYISRALQSSGLGREAMTQVERLAALPPFNNTVLALDTMDKDFYFREDTLRALYDDEGQPRPNPLRSNQDWYERLGYCVVGRDMGKYPWWRRDGFVLIPCVYMKKNITRV